MRRIAVIGGGISGLSAAYTIQKQNSAGTPLEPVLFESGSRLGGVISTEHTLECVVEAGPDSFLTEKPWAADLCRQLGIGDQLISSNDAERKTYMLVKGRLVPIPDGLMFMVPTKLMPMFFSPLFSWTTKLRIIREWFYHPHSSDSDLTVAQFVERHYGRQMVDRVADPLLAGVYGGSADRLSVNSVLQRFVQMEAKYGSLGRAMVAARKNIQGTPRPLFTSLKGGMQQLTDALAESLARAEVRLNTPVDAARPESGKWLLLRPGRTEEFDGVIVATPAHAAAGLLRAAVPALANELRDVEYSSSMTVVLAYDKATRASLPPGFGFLVPRTEHRAILAATFVHNKFPHRAPADKALIRCFIGGNEDAALFSRTDAQVTDVVRRDLHDILGIAGRPLFSAVHRWPKAMAQYGVGHAARVSRMNEIVASSPGLALAGNAYSGIGVPDCVRSGTEAAQKILRELGVVSGPAATT
jgi:protoporphyrinogen/coproporphyrinogen III oxidase